MSSCSFLDPASLLAQSAVSIRLGRRASNCSQTLLAIARRAPLNESSVQGNIKQPSTAASAPTQVFQSVSVDQLERHIPNPEDAGVARVLPPPRHGAPRRGSTLPSREAPLQIAVCSSAEHAVEELVPPKQMDAARQPPPEPRQADEEEGELEDAASEPQPDLQQPQLRFGAAAAAPAAQLPSDADDSAASYALNEHNNYGYLRHVQEGQQRLDPGRPKSFLAPPARPSQLGGPGPLRHRPTPMPNGDDPSAPPRRWNKLLRPRPIVASDWGQGGSPEQVLPVRSAAAATAAVAVAATAASHSGAADPQVAWSIKHSRTTPAVGLTGCGPYGSVGGSSPPQIPSSLSSSSSLADAACRRAAAASMTATATITNPSTVTDHLTVTHAGPGSLTAAPPPMPGPAAAAAAEPSAWSDGPSGGRWGGGLENGLLACRSVHSVQRFLQLMGPRADAELMGTAVVHLSHLVAEEPPDGDVERQLLAGLLDELTRRLRSHVRQLSRGRLAALVCAMSRLRCYDGPLLREVVAAARDAAAELTTRQAAGLIWALGKFHRDFSFRLEPGWATALSLGVLPRMPQAKPQEVAMMLYGSALLREPPPAAALTALLAASMVGMRAAGGPELSMTIWALATLRLYPGREWMNAFLDRCDVATRTFASGAAVSNVLYALASMRVQPPAPWMLNFMWQAQRRMNNMDAQSLVMMGWAMGRMRYRPDRKWLTRFFRYTQSMVLLPPARENALTAARDGISAQLQQLVSQRQLELWRSQQHRLRQQKQLLQRRAGLLGYAAAGGGGGSATTAAAAALPPQAYNVLLWSCVRLSCRPMGRWLPLLCAAVQPRLAAWPPHELSALLWGLARLRWRPRDEWMTEFCSAARSCLMLFQPPDCVMTLLALSKLCSSLGYRVSDGDLANALAQRLAPYYPRLQTTTLISVLLAISRVTPRVRPARLKEALAALLDRVRAIGAAVEPVVLASPPPRPAAPANSGAAGSLDAVDQQLDEQREVQAAVAEQQQQEGEEAEPQLNHALQPPSPLYRLQLSRPQHIIIAPRTAEPPPPSLPPQGNPSRTALPSLTARECANAIFAVGCVAVWPGYNDALKGLCGQLLRELLPRAFRLSPAFNGVDLVLLVHGVAMTRMRVSRQWLHRHEEQALRRLHAGELHPGQLRELHRAYHVLDYSPELLPVSAAQGRHRRKRAEEDKNYDDADGAEGAGNGDVGTVDGVVAAAAATVVPEAEAAAVVVVDGGSLAGLSARVSGDERGDEDRNRVLRVLQLSERSEAARARLRRAAQVRRRRVTAAIERRVAAARRQAAAEPELWQAALESGEVPAASAAAGVASAGASAGGTASGVVLSGELEEAERQLRLRRKTIRRFTTVVRRRGGTMNGESDRAASGAAGA